MKSIKTLVLLSLILAFSFGVSSKEAGSLTGDQALAKLVTGNRRYVRTAFQRPNQSLTRRAEVAKGQKPFAVILSCSDSRVPPEIVFDQGLGDLFVIRVAGNVIDDDILGSIEYAIEHLGSPLIMVLGHQRCGAVEAVVKGGEVPGHIANLVEAIKPAVEKTKGMPGDPLDNAVRANVGMVVDQLENSKPMISEFFHNGKVKIVGARYDLDNGRVEILK